MNMPDILKAIYELENAETTFSNCEKLAHLYIIRQMHIDGLKTMVEPLPADQIKRELSDIFPYYEKYCDAKKQYQLNHTDKENVLNTLQSLCREVLEFIQVLYSNTDMPEERHIIVEILNNIPF